MTNKEIEEISRAIKECKEHIENSFDFLIKDIRVIREANFDEELKNDVLAQTAHSD